MHHVDNCDTAAATGQTSTGGRTWGMEDPVERDERSVPRSERVDTSGTAQPEAVVLIATAWPQLQPRDDTVIVRLDSDTTDGKGGIFGP